MTPQKLLAPLFILFIGSTVAISNETCSKETPKMPTLAKQNHVLPLKLPAIGCLCSNPKKTSISNDSGPAILLLSSTDLMAAIHSLTNAITTLNIQVQTSSNETNTSSLAKDSARDASTTFPGVMSLINNFVSSISGLLDIFAKAVHTVLSWRQLVHLRQLQHLPLLALIHRQANPGVGRPRRADVAMV